VRLAIRANPDQAFTALDQFAARVQAIAVPRALNKLADQAQTAGLRAVNSIYKIGPRTMEKYVATTYAFPNKLEATLTAKGAGFPLYVFDPRQTRTGVSVSLKGRRVIIPHAFIATMPNGHVGVFARGAYGGKSNKRQLKATGAGFGRFTFGRGRLPINELYTLSPPDAFGNSDVTKAMDDRVEEQAAKVLQQEIRFVRLQSFGE
jgi:hypothetical protein